MDNIMYYESPTLEIVEIQLEQGLMKGSGKIDPETNGAPEIEDWTDGGVINPGDFDL
ncbi:hypothetical protein [uncultured Bacteroides sp.]|uniref:hypothetical protein n=1 Tax=uncultured Bacteroides sp. TaxID=162156 RepID=UPI002586D1EB|nr:hypothetical protein [uncultured Bacteroides sp.]